MARAIGVDRKHVAIHHRHQIDHDIGAGHRRGDARRVGDIGADDVDLADPAERLKEEGRLGIALGNAHPDAALKQQFAHITTDESAAAKDGDEARRAGGRGGDHGLAPSVGPRPLTSRAAPF